MKIISFYLIINPEPSRRIRFLSQAPMKRAQAINYRLPDWFKREIKHRRFYTRESVERRYGGLVQKSSLRKYALDR